MNDAAGGLVHNLADKETDLFLALLADEKRIQNHRIPGVRTVLVILSAHGMVYDTEALRYKIVLTYPDAVVFFRTPSGKPVGAEAPRHIDLLIDMTGPGQRESLFYSKKLRRMARVAVGRRANFLRSRIYDRVFDEKKAGAIVPDDFFMRECFVQTAVLELAGVALAQRGELAPLLNGSNP